jgi:hypothetical protein
METLVRMEKRWHVFHGTKNLGLMTAKEIREALRQGTLDPFDKVSREGSNIREDLIEVDEIFKESAVTPLSQAAGAESTEHAAIVDRQVQLQDSSESSSLAGSWIRESSLRRTPEVEATRNDNVRPSSAKRYYVLDRDKVLGPLSALEIQSLFNRGMLNKKVRVQKVGGDKIIPITQFIASYSDDRLKELAEDGKIPQQIGIGSPSSKVLNELARMANSQRLAQNRRNKLYIALILAGLVLGALAYFAIEQAASRRAHRSSIESESTDRSESTPSPPSRPSRPQRPRLVQKNPEPAPSDLPTASSEPQAKEEVRGAEPPLRKTSKDTERPAIQNRPKTPPRAPERKVTPPSSRPAQTNPARSSPPPRRPPPPAPVPQGPGVIAKALSSAGRIQTIGPLSFNLASLEACGTKCTLTLRDTSGASMKAVFFKNSYYDQLKTKSRSVFLTGSTKIDRGELTLIIQDVR